MRVVDTGGWAEKSGALADKVAAQAEQAVASADAVLFIVDVTVGATFEDERVARLLNRSGKPVILVANKADNEWREVDAWSVVSLGCGDPWPVSALHGRGMGDLLDEVVRIVAGSGGSPPAPSASVAGGEGPEGDDPEPPEEAAATSVAIVGRPNVGKSTLFNRLVGEERSVVHDLPGTTRDSVDTLVETSIGPLRFVDTAGMRRRARVEPGTERFAMVRALDSVDRADVALLVVDSTAGVTHQDQRLAERLGAAGSPAVVILNKWDIASSDQREEAVSAVGDRLAFLPAAPVLRVSASRGTGMRRILPAIEEAIAAYHRRIPTGELNRAVRALQERHPATGARIRYAVQGATDPPTFTLFATKRLPQTYLRYVSRSLRQHFGLGPTPVVLRVRTPGR
jgi:GTP-binding protein